MVNKKSGNSKPASSLDDVLGNYDINSYKQLVGGLKNFYKTKDSDKLNVIETAKSLYSPLVGVISKMPEVYKLPPTQAILGSVKYNIEGNTISKDGLGGLADYSKGITSKLWNEAKSSMSDKDIKSLCEMAMLGGGMFGSLTDQLSAHDSFKGPSRYGTVLKEIGEELNNGDTSQIGTYFQKLSSAKDDAAFQKYKYTQDEAKSIIDSGNKLYQQMAGEMSDAQKVNLQKDIYSVISEEYKNSFSGIDMGHARKVFENADPLDGLSALLTYKTAPSGP